MPPRKNRRKIEQDEQIDRKAQSSKWANLLDEAEEEEIAPKKQIFNFDFSKEHLLLNQKQPVHKEEPKVQLTDQEKAQLQRILQKQLSEKEEKERIRRERKMEKKKKLQRQKQEEQVRKEQVEKAQAQLERMVEKNKQNSDSKKILLVFLVLMVVLGLLQYQKDIYAKIAKFRITAEVDFYQVMEVASSITDAELKSQYKKLVIKYHPDKNPNCHSCKEKFNSIMEAWEVLGNQQKRKHYDDNSGFVTQIPSDTLKLTPDNYEWMLYDSDWVWVVQVYDSTDRYSHYFASFWEQFFKKYEGLIKVGRIDVWHQTQMKSYIPYKFQIFPGIYSVYQGHENLCQILDMERPLRSLQLCVQNVLQDLSVPKISDWAEVPEIQGKLSVILGGAIKLSSNLKLIQSKFLRYLAFYQIQDSDTKVMVRGRQHKFDLNVGSSKTIYNRYSSFLEGLIVQKKSMCQIHHQCRQRPCLLLLEDARTYLQQRVSPYPLISVKEQEQFTSKIEAIKNMTDQFQKFEIGFFQDGKIELGNFDQVEELKSQNGEVIDFVCHKETLIDKMGKAYSYLLSLINAK